MASTTNNQNKSSASASIGTKLKGGMQVAKGVGDSVRGTTFGAIDTVEQRDSSVNDEIARRGRMEIEQGIAMIKGRPVDTTTMDGHNRMNTNGSLQGWGSGINGANANATTNATGFPAPKGQEYAQNSTTANMKSDLGRGPNAYSGNTEQPPQYPASGGPPPQEFKAGMGNTHPTQMGSRPAMDAMAGERDYQQRQDADQAMH
ncbi:hypothetical protein MVEN_01823300 [Mycena venus]|uniref:Uncharacterized protein n=1 Tax=Mycena venus TaxID=2733690 RepID=A0A8H6XJU0_9AGAR|nr:hypothetical protein MVEN_01823300 [Mycena venus]